MNVPSRGRPVIVTIVLLAGLAAASPAAPLRRESGEPLITKWLPGERKPKPTSPSLPSLTLPSSTQPLFVLPSFPTSGPVVAPSAPSVAPNVTVRSRLEPDSRRFHLGEPIHLFVELSWTGDAGDVQPEAAEEPVLMNLAKKGMVQSSQVVAQDVAHTVVVTYHYILEPTAEGAASIEPIQVNYRFREGSETLRLTSDRFALTILPRRWPWRKILLGTLATLTVLGAGTAGTIAAVARARRAREAAKVPPPPSPFELMKADLDAIRKVLREGVAKDGYDSVERFVRKVLALRSGSDLRSATISELSDRLANEEALDSTVRDRAASILDRCAQVKFAGYVPTVADQDQVLADCRLLLDEIERQR